MACHIELIGIASTPEEQAQGLKGVRYLPPGQGMLFIFGDSAMRRFTMMDVLLPLDILFADTNGRVVNIETRAPGYQRPIRSAEPAMFVLEAVAGTFRAAGVGRGSRMRLAPDVPLAILE